MQQQAPRRLLVSILSLGRPEHIIRQWSDLSGWLAHFAAAARMTVHVTIRNNHPGVSFAEVAELIEQTRETLPELEATLFTGGANLGFGGGHNANFRAVPSDFLLVLNDDIGLPHLDWLADALALLERDRRTALIADAGSPQDLSPFFGNGSFPAPHHLRTLKYAEASILLARSTIIEEIGLFDPAFDWAMGEDADLSLRAQQHGYKLAWLPIPHQHWRSTSFNSLPGSVRSSILEHNRARLFSTWRHAFATGRVGRFVVYDLWSDGLGDVFCALPHLAAALHAMTPRQRANVVINTPHTELMTLLDTPDVRVTRHEDVGALEMALGSEGIVAIHSMRDINYALPFDIHALICGALGLQGASAEQLAAFAAALRGLVPADRLPAGLTEGSYCVLHLEFARSGHHGRALSAARARELLRLCAGRFDTTVLVGRERRLVPPEGVAGRVLDLQGGLAQDKLIGLIAHARAFVGIDSFPAHVAQAAGVRAAVFFGSVHPLTRAWQPQAQWPITAGLDCTGCYHTQLEPSVPFCMRYDEACVRDATAASMARTLEAMAAGAPFDWSPLTLRLRALQGRLVHLLRHHPAPPERVFRRVAASNERVSNLIYQMTDAMAELLRGQYQTTAMQALSGRIAELEALGFAQEAELEEARRQLRVRPPAAPPAAPARVPTQIAQLRDLKLTAARCRVEVAEQWLEVTAQEEDPQLFLPPLEGRGGRVRLRLSCIADAVNLVQVFWAASADAFTLDRMAETTLSPAGAVIERAFDLVEGETLCLRIDPLAAAGRMRLRGSLAGAFRLPCSSRGATEPAVAPTLLTVGDALGT